MAHRMEIGKVAGGKMTYARCLDCSYRGRKNTDPDRTRDDIIAHKYKTDPAKQAKWAGLHHRKGS